MTKKKSRKKGHHNINDGCEVPWVLNLFLYLVVTIVLFVTPSYLDPLTCYKTVICRSSFFSSAVEQITD